MHAPIRGIAVVIALAMLLGVLFALLFLPDSFYAVLCALFFLALRAGPWIGLPILCCSI
jgi:hypothetical protein